MMLRFGVGTRKRYVPAGSVTPGNTTGALNVKMTRLSRGCAFAGVVMSASKATAQTKRTMVLSMYGLLRELWRRHCRVSVGANVQRSYLGQPIGKSFSRNYLAKRWFLTVRGRRHRLFVAVDTSHNANLRFCRMIPPDRTPKGLL